MPFRTSRVVWWVWEDVPRGFQNAQLYRYVNRNIGACVCFFNYLCCEVFCDICNGWHLIKLVRVFYTYTFKTSVVFEIIQQCISVYVYIYIFIYISGYIYVSVCVCAFVVFYFQFSPLLYELYIPRYVSQVSSEPDS